MANPITFITTTPTTFITTTTTTLEATTTQEVTNTNTDPFTFITTLITIAIASHTATSPDDSTATYVATFTADSTATYAITTTATPNADSIAKSRNAIFATIVYIVIAVVGISVIVFTLAVRLLGNGAQVRAREEEIALEVRSGDIRKRTSKVLQWTSKLHSETDDLRLQIEEDDIYDQAASNCSFTNADDYENANEKDMFGRTWDFIKPLSLLKDQIYINETGVSVGLRKYSNQYEHELKLKLYFSVHSSFKALASELKIKNYQMLVSPAAELTLSSKTHLRGHVVLELPLCKLGTFSSLGVHWISTPMTSISTVEDIPYEKDPLSSSLDCFYTLLDSGTVRVYTNHFSLFFCTCCKSDIRFELSAQACARVGVIDGYPTLQIKLFFQGLQNRLKKREENEHDLDRKKGFNVIEGGVIHLLKKQNSKKKSGFLKCRLSTLLEERCPKWEHIKRGEDQCPIYQPEQVVDVAKLIRCWHKEHELCYCINWYLKCEKRYCHRLPIVIDVENTRHLTESVKTIQTTFTMEVDISTRLSMIQDPIRTLIDNIGHEKMRRLLDELELRSTQDRGRAGDEKEQWYETLSAIKTDPNLSLRLGSAMAKVGVALCDQNIFGLINAESRHENQHMARNEPEQSYDYPETNSIGSSYADLNSPFNANIRDPESAYLSLKSIANDSGRSKRPQLQPPRHNNEFRESNTPSYSQTSTPRHAQEEGATARPIIYPELKVSENHAFVYRPTPLGASNDSDETDIKEIVDSNLDRTNRKETMEVFSHSWV